MAINYRGQKYSKLKKAALQSGELFHDSEFPANNKSLFYSKVDPTIEWKRPNVSYYCFIVFKLIYNNQNVLNVLRFRHMPTCRVSKMQT